MASCRSCVCYAGFLHSLTVDGNILHKLFDNNRADMIDYLLLLKCCCMTQPWSSLLEGNEGSYRVSCGKLVWGKLLLLRNAKTTETIILEGKYPNMFDNISSYDQPSSPPTKELHDSSILTIVLPLRIPRLSNSSVSSSS